MKTTLSLGFGVEMTCFGREPVGDLFGEIPCFRSSLMFFSVTEEAIHLPCALDRDMVGVLSGNKVDQSLSTGA